MLISVSLALASMRNQSRLPANASARLRDVRIRSENTKAPPRTGSVQERFTGPQGADCSYCLGQCCDANPRDVNPHCSFKFQPASAAVPSHPPGRLYRADERMTGGASHIDHSGLRKIVSRSASRTAAASSILADPSSGLSGLGAASPSGCIIGVIVPSASTITWLPLRT